ncbi:hypothetical protein K461DRAFT_316324 [Myriangium duriaei CBS 260.36]|uniref:2EXR domain-containing protein n=1 Tax=Myriangium duriaei CBS 260.36 TaxID=1168546 RepID=A0A9P4IVJ1_9PEZI|nr:hypothetical protein K461DRAFT_316324 [Myriangium duriaei CBS 260.36]
MTSSTPSPAVLEPTFHLFPRLPPELRFQIWRYARPHEGPFLRLYHFPQHFNHGDSINRWIDYHRNPHDTTPKPHFDSKKLSITYSPIPSAAQVNREARAVILHGAFVMQESDGIDRWAIRPFDALGDILYLEWKHLAHLVRIYVLVQRHTGSFPRMTDILGGVRRVAMGEAVLISEEFVTRQKMVVVAWMLHAIGVLHLVRDVPDELRNCLPICTGEGGVWTWNVAMGRFDYTAGSGVVSREEREIGRLAKAMGDLAFICTAIGLVTAEIREVVVAQQ